MSEHDQRFGDATAAPHPHAQQPHSVPAASPAPAPPPQGPQHGHPQYGRPQYGQPQPGQQPDGQAPSGQPQYGVPYDGQVQQRECRSSRNQMLVGGGFALIGLVITIGTVFFGHSGHFYVSFWPIVGAIYFFRGLTRFTRARR